MTPGKKTQVVEGLSRDESHRGTRASRVVVVVVVVRTFIPAVTAMIMAFFPLKKLRRNGKHLLFVAILLVGAVAVYNEMSAAKAWNSENSKFVIFSIKSLCSSLTALICNAPVRIVSDLKGANKTYHFKTEVRQRIRLQ